MAIRISLKPEELVTKTNYFGPFLIF